MVIAIDMDGTWAADKELFEMFAKKAISKGHIVLCVTARPESDRNKITKILKGCVNGLYLTEYEQKKIFMDRVGVKIDIWIDDHPETIPYAKQVDENIKAYKAYIKND